MSLRCFCPAFAPVTLATLGLALGSIPSPTLASMGHGPESTPAQTDDHHPADPSPTDPGPSHGHHHPATLEVPTGQPVPTLQLVVHPDPVRGWNLEIQTTHFRFAPELINQANQPNTGHGHLYINGEKGERIYGPWLHLPHLPPGRHEISVSLNANGHEALTYQGQPIVSTVVVEVLE